MVASLALYALVAAIGNAVDGDYNFEFVRHALSMDTTFPANRLLWRAIRSPFLWTAAYWLIVAMEAAAGLSLTIGAWQMARALRGPGALFNQAKRYSIIGVGIGFLLWFTGFIVIGGEWFAMWQSSEWNGIQGAFRPTMVMLGVGIFVMQPDADPVPLGGERG